TKGAMARRMRRKSARHIEMFGTSGKETGRRCFPSAAQGLSGSSVCGDPGSAGNNFLVTIFWSPLAAVRHRGPRLLRRQRIAFLQQLDRMLIRRANERHIAVARRAIDRHAAFHQSLANGVNIVDLISEMTEIACLAVIFA